MTRTESWAFDVFRLDDFGASELMDSNAFIAAFYRVRSFRAAVDLSGWSALTLGGAVLIVLLLSVWLFGR